MKKILMAIALVGIVSQASAYWQYYAVNNFGQTFFGTGPTQYHANAGALSACQTSTPIGYSCWLTAACNWYGY